jgi:hypothetical protein
MTRIIRTVHRYKQPPRKQQAPALPGPAVVTARQSKAEPAAVTAPPPANDDGKPAPKAPAIVSTASRKRVASDAPHRPMELPLSRRPVERKGDDYQQLKAANDWRRTRP